MDQKTFHSVKIPGRDACGIGVVGGLLFAMFLTLYFIPALFYVTNKDR